MHMSRFEHCLFRRLTEIIDILSKPEQGGLGRVGTASL
jgi:hypothetical protein